MSDPLDLDEIVRSWQEYEDISPLPLIAEIRRLTAENEALRDKQADLNMAWAESLADAYVERDALQALIDAAVGLHIPRDPDRAPDDPPTCCRECCPTWTSAALQTHVAWPCATVAALTRSTP